jgi:SAM-dependent methyltransferase
METRESNDESPYWEPEGFPALPSFSDCFSKGLIERYQEVTRMIAELYSLYLKETDENPPLSMSQFVHSSVLERVNPDIAQQTDDLIAELKKSLAIAKSPPQDLASAQRYQSRAFRKHWIQSTLIVRGQRVHVLDLGSGPGQVGYVLSQKLTHYRDPSIDVTYYPVDKDLSAFATMEGKAEIFVSTMVVTGLLPRDYIDRIPEFEFDIDHDLTFRGGERIRKLVQENQITHISAYNFLQHVQPRGMEELLRIVDEFQLYFTGVVPAHDLYGQSRLRFKNNPDYPLMDARGEPRRAVNREEYEKVWGISREIVEIEELGVTYEVYYYTKRTWNCFCKRKIVDGLQLIPGVAYWNTITSDPLLDTGEAMRKMVLIWHPHPSSQQMEVQPEGVYDEVILKSQAKEVDIDTINMIVKRMHLKMASIRPKKNGILVYLDGEYAVDRRCIAYTLPIYLRGYAEILTTVVEGKEVLYLHPIKITQYKHYRIHAEWSSFMTWFMHPLTRDSSGFFTTETIQPNEVIEGIVVMPKEKMLPTIDEFYLKPYPVADLRVNIIEETPQVENFPHLRVVVPDNIRIFSGSIYEMVTLEMMPGSNQRINVALIIGHRKDKTYGEGVVKAKARIDFYEKFTPAIKQIYAHAGAYYPTWLEYVKRMRLCYPTFVRRPVRQIRKRIMFSKTLN